MAQPETQTNRKSFARVAERLYRNGNKIYYVLLKVNGKQIARSLEDE